MTEHILVVEDDRSTRDLIARYLADNHFRVSTAVTGAEGQGALGAERVDLIRECLPWFDRCVASRPRSVR